MNAMRNCCWNT